MTKQNRLILLYVGLFCLGAAIVAYFWQPNQYYSNAYTPVVERSRQNRSIIEQNRQTAKRNGQEESEQPSPAGFRERDMDKNQGDRYSTY